MSTRNITSYQTILQQLLFGCLFVAIVAFAVRSLMFGTKSNATFVVAGVVAIWAFLALGERYWLMLPVLAMSNIHIKGIPFNGPEMGCLAVIAIHFVRFSLKLDPSARFDRNLLVVLPVVLWIAFIFALNPVGMAMFGSDTIGGRFYFQIFVSFFALVAMSTQSVDEAGAKILFFALLASLLFNLGRGIVFAGADPDASAVMGDAPEVSTRYAFVVCANIFTWVFSLFSLSGVLWPPSRFALVALLGLLTIYSGKRRAFGTLLIVPVLRVLLTGKEKALTALMAGLAVIFLAFAVAGDGSVYRLPQSARRALSIFVPKYETGSAAGMRDYFREHMRAQARAIIAENPWFGRKGFAMDLDDTAWMLFGGGRTSLYAGHAYAGNWHSAWYAYAADFGIPCMLMWAGFTLYLVFFVVRSCRTVTEGVWLPACCLFFGLRILTEIAFSYTSGHSAATSVNTWILYGMLLAIVQGYRKSHPVPQT